MAPSCFDPTAPPTRESVTDKEGLPTTGSDPFSFMVWLSFVEDTIKTANPTFFELYTTAHRPHHHAQAHGCIASAEHATELATTVNPTIHTFAAPAPAKPRTATAMPDGLKAQFNAQPDLLLKYDREGFNTLDSWLTNTAMRKAFAATTGSTGRRMLIAYCTKSESRKPGTESIIKGTPRCTKETKGERSDLNRARELIAIKRTWTEVINDASL